MRRRAQGGERDTRRVVRGDWQTPDALAEAVLQCIARDGAPAAVLEPTCGQGAFLAAAARCFPQATLCGFDVSEEYVARARGRLPPERSAVCVADFFTVPWERVVSGLGSPLWVVGNPPWVTNATQGALGVDNLPVKTNARRVAGLDALTGRSNFDISEWMLVRLLEALRGRFFSLAMLCKASVARRVIEAVGARAWSLDGELRTIDAGLHFGAAVEAVLLRVWPARGGRPRGAWPIFKALEASEPSRRWGVVEGGLCNDLDAYERTRDWEGKSALTWRSGLKHDCARVMELNRRDGHWVNGWGERVEVEPEHVFPLLKGSDVANGRLTPTRGVIVTQRRLGEDTRALRETAPRLWTYLCRHRLALEGRRSRIYRGQPPFALFGIGAYAFAPYKIALCGFYKRLGFSLLYPFDGRPVMVDDTVYFLPCATEPEARRILAVLSGERARAFFEARVFWDAKRPLGKALLQRLSLEKLLAEEGDVAMAPGDPCASS